MWELIRRGANIKRKDNYFATALDYAKLLGNIKQGTLQTTKIKFAEEKKIKEISLEKFAEISSSIFCENVFCDKDYIEELMFSSLSIENPDMSWRKKYCPLLSHSSGDSNLILSFIDKSVGYGVFAAFDFLPGDFIVKYVGKLEKGFFFFKFF
jgi:ankyrin repeat protein